MTKLTKEIFISSTPHETRLAIVEDEQLVEIHYERENEYTLAGSMYKGKVTRVLPGMQSAFVDIGLERDAFLYVTDFLEDQDDSGEFERTALPAPKEQKQPRYPREPQSDNTSVAEADMAGLELGDGIEIPAGIEQEGREGEEEGGSRRWRGRRGRRRGKPGTPSADAAKPVADAAPITQGITLEINSDDFDAEEFAPRYVAKPSNAGQTAAIEQEDDMEGEVEDFQSPAVPLEDPSDDWFSPEPIPVNEVAASEPESEMEERPRRGRRFSEDTDDAPSGPPTLMLPGETLSKYTGKKGDRSGSAAPRNSTTVTAKPSTMVEVPMAWDGSAVLPGETLKKKKNRNQPKQQARIEPVPVEASPEHEPQRFIEVVQEEILIEDQPFDAEASHNIDPAPHSEFRLGRLFGLKDKKKDAEEETKSEPATSFIDKKDVAQPRTFTPGNGEVEEELIDEDEYDFEPLRGHHEDDAEELEEETLDSDIGGMVRDSHVDERAAKGSEADDAGQPRARRSRRGRKALPAVAEVAASPRRTGRGDERHADRTADRAPDRKSEGGTDRSSDRSSDRGEERRGGRRGAVPGGIGTGNRRQSAQTMSLPAITELLKPGQEILVQIAKEPIAKKGARITSHIALPGRFLVYMPTVNHVGVSRKIATDEERQRLKRILLSEKADASGGFIVRTAAGGASEEELRSDIRFLINLWVEIKQRSETSKSPALIYHDLNLVERILRDQVTDKFSAIWVDTEAEYERVVKFLGRFQPSLVRHVKLYSKETPLFEQFGIQEEVNKALKSKVWLKSGGSIVINQTEALVAIDINTGKYVGKTARLEDTILKTNLDSIPEIVRQIRLRDLGGIIVIDFIDMDERRNRNKVMAALEEELKRDRAPSKVLQFNDFGLVAITRKRVKQSLERTLSMPCLTCQGTGMVKNPTTVCNEIFVELRKMHKHLDRGEIMLRVHPEVVKQLKQNGAGWMHDLEEMAGRTILLKSDAAIHPEQFDIQ